LSSCGDGTITTTNHIRKQTRKKPQTSEHTNLKDHRPALAVLLLLVLVSVSFCGVTCQSFLL
jgi:hypothetical protein